MNKLLEQLKAAEQRRAEIGAQMDESWRTYQNLAGKEVAREVILSAYDIANDDQAQHARAYAEVEAIKAEMLRQNASEAELYRIAIDARDNGPEIEF